MRDSGMGDELLKEEGRGRGEEEGVKREMRGPGMEDELLKEVKNQDDW